MEKEALLNKETDKGKVEPVEITEEMQRSYLDYAMSVIVQRALPDVRDGLKPVHRRILYALNELGLTSEAKYRKSATVVGEVLGKYHPHGDAPVYDALVRLAQDFAMRYPLVDGQGNFGSIDGDPPAAMRYTECRLSKISAQLLVDIDKDTVDFFPNFDATRNEPTPLPAILPNLLLNGGSGIAVGMATNIPPHNLTEVTDAIIYLINNPDAVVEDLLKFIKGPDFPTGGSIYDQKEITAAYATGKGKIIMRAKADIEETNNRLSIVVSELPYQVNKALLIARIAQLVKEKRLEGISDLRDESDRRGMQIAIELKKDARPQSILNQLYKHTSMQLAFNVNTVALVDGTPQTLTLKVILTEYIRHRQNVVTRRAKFDLEAAEKRAHILEGLKIAVSNIDAVIETIKKSSDSENAKLNLMSKFKLTEIQATAILDMQLRRLAALEREKIEEEYKETIASVAHLKELLSSPKKILEVIEKELATLKEKYGDPRRTRVFKTAVGEFSEEDLVPQEQIIITITKSGYIKRSNVNLFRTQRRGGKGVAGLTMKEEDSVYSMLSANTHDQVLFFTNKGRVFQIRAYELPEGTRVAKGAAIVNILDLEATEKITAVLNYDGKSSGQYLIMATKKGLIKKTKTSEFEHIRRSGMIAIRLNPSDELIYVRLTNGSDEIIMVTKNGQSIKFSEKDVRSMGRATAGVIGIKLSKAEDELVCMDRVEPDGDLFTVSERGFGKKTPLKSWPRQRRAGSGVKGTQVSEKTGKVVASQVIPKGTQNIVLTSSMGQVIKLPIRSVPKLQRQTQGVILIRLSNREDFVASATAVPKTEEETGVKPS